MRAMPTDRRDAPVAAPAKTPAPETQGRTFVKGVALAAAILLPFYLLFGLSSFDPAPYEPPQKSFWDELVLECRMKGEFSRTCEDLVAGQEDYYWACQAEQGKHEAVCRLNVWKRVHGWLAGSPAK